jgi:hypothetical protein
LISFCLGEFLPMLLTLRETKVKSLSIMGRAVQGSLCADRSLLLTILV